MQQPPPYSSGYPPGIPPPSQYPPQNQPPYQPQSQSPYPAPPQSSYPPQSQSAYPPAPGNAAPNYYGAPPPNPNNPPHPYPYTAPNPSYNPSGYPSVNPYPPGGQGGPPPASQPYPSPNYNPSQPPSYPPYGTDPHSHAPYSNPYSPQYSPAPYYPPAPGAPNQYPSSQYPQSQYPPSQYPPYPQPGGPQPPQYPGAPSPASAPPPSAPMPPSSTSLPLPSYPPLLHSGPPPAAAPPPMPAPPPSSGPVFVGGAAAIAKYPAGPEGHHLTAQNFPAIIGKASEDGCGCLHAPHEMGPMLRYNTMDLNDATWRGSVLFVLRNPTPEPPPPKLTITVLENRAPVYGPYPVTAHPLHNFHGWHFWRFDLVIPMGQGQAERCVQYGLEGRQASWSFWVPGLDQSWHWSYYSCAGYSSSMAPEVKVNFDTLIMELMRRHRERPHHLCVGGGDQLYNDQVFRLETVAAWQGRPRELREIDPFTPEMEAEAETYYFAHYMSHYSHRWLSELVANIPQVMMWDDHDIFDGFGSYPEPLQKCQVFQRLYQVARFFYLLFQQHTTDGLAEHHGLIRTGTALSQLSLLGPRVALLSVDMRSERTKEQIIPPEGWTRMDAELRKLPPTIKQVVVGSGVPVVYPSMAEVESFMESVSEWRRNPTKAGIIMGAIHNVLGENMNMAFDEPELLDDLNDHWNAKGHLKEKHLMVKLLQDLAVMRGMRFSFLSGDVHLCATGRLRTQGKEKKETDPNYMLQVVSSAIVNNPPPDGLVAVLTSKGLTSSTVFGQTEERMRATFGGGFMNVANIKSKLLNRRNFCLVQEEAGAALLFTLVVEMPGNKFKLYPTSVPPLAGDLSSAMGNLSMQRSSTMPSGAAARGAERPGSMRSHTMSGHS